MKHIFEQKVYYADTDAYGVVWHGTYLRWMETGRIELLNLMGLNLLALQKANVMLPVTGINIRFKSPAKLDDTVIVETSLTKLSSLTASFSQTIKEKLTGRIFIQAEVEGVAVDSAGKLYRRMPDDIRSAFENALKNE